jgi:hypothetical protein
VSPSRQERRALKRRADRVLAHVHYTPLRFAPDASPDTHVVLLGEHTAPQLVRREAIAGALVSAGLWWTGHDEALAAIADADDGLRYPVLILIDGWVTCVRITIRALARGGDA